ncbi:glycoside hydrolase family 3 N-terminal domain-containing protein [Microbacterium profundi]|uniref:Glycoside hydrolase family 3 N-terminal domain-containing protein n=1 Tax=Microbacterium profundi TaxID=450380 RepID=A0ABV3LF75_9MICO|nr:glycoside hydrolase family 3 N-terminal domain-containing protein [Microbacterium profundi]
MTDELTRLANSVLWPGFFGTSLEGDGAPAWLLAALEDDLAGVVYFGQNISAELPELSARIRAANPHALIGIDEEGGSVTRLEVATGSTLPGAAQLGIVDDVAATAATGAELARRARAAGINVVLGPVADVNTDPRNPVIGVRAFGADAALVSRHVVATVEGLQHGGVAACVKHFPGHGDTHLDSHHALPVITLDPAEIEDVHLEPFRAAIAAGVDSIMTAHIVVPAWGERPATLNPAVLGRLREMGFEGVIITDALDMAAVRESVGIGGAAVQALAAGADLLCIGNPTNPGSAAHADQDERDYLTAREAVVAALRDGTLPRERVEQARDRVRMLAAKRAGTVEHAPRDADDESDTATYDASEIVRRALRVADSTGASHATPDAAASVLSVIDARRRSTLAVDSAASYVADGLAGDGFRVRLDVDRATDEERDAALNAAIASDGRLVLLIDRPDVADAQRALVELASVRDADAVVVNVGLPARHPLSLPIVEVAAASRVGAEAARDLLLGR